MHVATISRCLPLFFCLVFASSAIGGETDVYESLETVEIGRVFLSPEQRARLDQRRGKRNAPAAGPRDPVAARNRWPDAAGYIVSGTGERRVWSNGDFIAAEKVSNVRFPGDVRIRRNAPSAEPETADDAD